MLMGDFISAVELQLPILFVLMNNGAYAMEANAMASAQLTPVGVSLRDVRFDQIARACGGVGSRVTAENLRAALVEAGQSRRPVLLDVQVAPTRLPTATL